MNVNYPLLGDLELSFYFSDERSEDEKMNGFALAVIPLGVEITGGRTVQNGQLVSLTTEDFQREIQLTGLKLSTIHVKTPMQLTRPGFSDAIMMLRELMPRELREIVSPSITIRSNYRDVFDVSSSPRDVTPELSMVGERVYTFFLNVVKSTQPAYAAITVDNGLPTPEELSLTHIGVTAFRNFYVDGSYIGESNVKRISTVYAGAYIESVATGIYVSCSPFFNPAHIWLGWDIELARQYREVAKIIAGRTNK